MFWPSFEIHLLNLRRVFQRVRDARLKLKPEKCKFAHPQVKFLGHVVSEDGLSTDPEKLEKIKNWPIPKSVPELRSFLGLGSYYRRFVQGFAKVACPLNRLLEKRDWRWTQECDSAFAQLKSNLCASPILAYPNFKEKFLLDCDASEGGVGVVLSQLDVQGGEHPIAFYSRSLSKPERR